MARWKRNLIIVAGFVGLASLLLIRPFVLEAFQIPAGSMVPTLLVGDHIMVKKWRRHPERGDVVVFKYPLDPSTDYVKRVVAVGGDTVEMKAEELIVNGQVAARRRLSKECPDGVEDSLGLTTSCVVWAETLGDHTYQTLTTGATGRGELDAKQVPADALFVLGDNRDNSSDSRVWGFVPLENVKGTVGWVWWSRDPKGVRVRWERMNTAVK